MTGFDAAPGGAPARAVARRRLLAGAAAACIGAALPRPAAAKARMSEAAADGAVDARPMLEPGSLADSPLLPLEPAPPVATIDRALATPAPLRPAGLAPPRSLAEMLAPPSEPARSERRLNLLNPHTGESLDVVYYRDGPVDEAVTALDALFRDWRYDVVEPIDRSLYDLLFALQIDAGFDKPMLVLSGFRTPATNAMLAQRLPGVAPRSFHLYGRAVDIVRPGYALDNLYRHALALEVGGVGHYPERGFIHVDTGPVRSWS